MQDNWKIRQFSIGLQILKSARIFTFDYFVGKDVVLDFDDEYSTFYGTSERGLQSSFMESFQAAKFLLCDEFVHDTRLIRNLRDDQHCVLFTSTKDDSHPLQSTFPNSNWVSFQLSFSLRSTGVIANFANDWINRDELIDTNLPCRPAQNFEGEPNDIIFVSNGDFVPTSVRLISLYYERTSGLKILPVICFMSRETRWGMLMAIHESSINCDLEELGVRQAPQPGMPLVKLFKPGELEGSEFSSVIILINFKHVIDIGHYIRNEFLTSISRATTKTAIIINQEQLNECRESENQNGSCCAFEAHERYFDEIRRERDVTTRYLMIGPKLPTVSDFVQSDHQPAPIREIPDIILYVARDGTASFWYCQDVYQWSHLEKVYNGGIRKIVILDDSFYPPFYQHTIRMITLYSEKKNYAFNIRSPKASTRESAGELISILKYCQELCKRPPELSTFYRVWARRPYTNYFTWKQWKAKATEAYRVNKNFLALELYTVTLDILKDEYNALLLLDGNVLLAAENRIERAKLLTNRALMSVNATKVKVDSEEYIHRKHQHFCYQDLHPFEFLFSLIRAIQFSLKAIEVNACWIRSYNRLSKAIEELKQYFADEQHRMEDMDSESSSDVRIKELIDREKKNKSIVELWGDECDYYPAASTIEAFSPFQSPAKILSFFVNKQYNSKKLNTAKLLLEINPRSNLFSETPLEKANIYANNLPRIAESLISQQGKQTCIGVNLP